MKDAPLLDLLAEHDRLMAWWADFLAKCAARQARRLNGFSARSRKGAETRRINDRKALAPPFGTALSPFGSSPSVSPASPLQSTGADDWDPCPACHFILVACDCDAFQGERH